MYGTKMFYTVTVCLSRWVCTGKYLKRGDLCTKKIKVKPPFFKYEISLFDLHDNTGPKMVTRLYIKIDIRYSTKLYVLHCI